MRSLFLFMLLVLSAYVNYAQKYDKSYIPNIIKSIEPTTAKIHSYNALPISNYTGKPTINVPIFNIKLSDNFSMPLDLSYDCHIKVDDIPSRNGLGWIINMMGSVTRNIKDISDFENLEYHTGPQGDYDQGVFNVSSLGWLETPAFYINGVDYADLMPDEYIVSAPGLSTRFVIKKDFTALELTNQLNKIDILIDTAYTHSTVFEGLQYPITSLKRLKRIILTTPLGIKYTFSLHDVLIRISDSYRACPGVVYDTRRRDVGNIYLSSIEDLSNKKKIEFEYDVFNIQDYSTTTSENFIGDNSGGWSSGPGIPPIIPCLAIDKTTIHYEQNYRVKKIKFPGGECTFQYTEQRQDLPGDYCLTGVEVKNNNGDIIKNNTLKYSYLSSLENCSQPECKRLKLDSMLECDNNGACLKYRFTYNEQYQLPKRGSNLTDFLGYYNGPQEASLRKPKLYIYPDSYEKTYLPFNLPSSPATIVLPGRSMDVNEAYLKTGILNKIEYPTGGYVALEFESNDFKFNNDIIKGGGLRVKKQILNYGNTQKEISYQYTINKNSTVSSGTIHSIPQFGLPVGVLLYKNYNDYFNYSLITRNSQSSIDVINGGYVGYKKVFVSETNNGYTEYTYTTEEDYPADNIVRTNYVEATNGNNPSLITNSGYPFTESNFENQSRFGQLKEEIQVSASGTIVRRQKNEYSYQVLDSIPTTLSAVYYTEPVHYSYYRNIIGKTLTIRRISFLPTIDSTIHYAGNKTLIDATTTTYRNNSFLPWQTFSVQSDGKTSATWTTRIMDTVFQDGPKESLRQNLLAQNRLLEDVFTYKSKGNSATLNAVDYLLFGDIVRFRQLNTRASIDINYTDEFRIEQYDNKGNPTQLWSRQDNTSCLLWDTAGLQVMAIAKGNNISLARMAYTSFEGGAWGGWTMNPGSAIFDNGVPVTGKKVFSGTIFKAVPIGNYTVSLWSIADTWINGQLLTQTPTKVIGIWRYFEVHLNNVSNIDVAGNTIDEVRLYPQGTQMTTYTFEPLIGMTSQCDINNRITYYEYDGFERLLRIRDDNKDIVKQMEYQYQIPTHSNAIWQTTGQTRCKPCPENGAYITNILQNEEKDNNPNSPTYYQTRWTDAGVSGSCTITADWQFVGSPRCRTENGVNTGQREQEKRDMNPCSPTYNQSEWVAIDMSCSTCPSPASWWANGSYRCATDGNGNNTGRRERMEVDQSRCSPTWLQFRWVDDGDACATCSRPSNWQATGTTRCQKNQYNSNTSFIEIQEQDMAACTPTYRWVMGPQNLTACPFCFKCTGEGKLCLNDACTFGVKVYTGAVQDAVTLKWTCIYHYEWNNGAIWSQDYTEESDRECTVN